MTYSPADDLAPRPLAQAIALHPEFYADPKWLDYESREIFPANWQIVGPEAWAAAPGDHFIADIAGAGVLVARGEDGVLRAFLNVCRHRGAPIAACAGTGAKRFNCPYHGWSYRLDGSLRAAPEMAEAEGFDPAQHGLIAAALEVWNGMVFVRLAPKGRPLADYLGGVDRRIRPIDLSKMTFERRETWPVAANWKVYADNYLEGYHVPSVHPALNDIIDYRGYATELEALRSMQTSAVANAEGVYGGDAVYYCFIYPNMMLNIVGGRVQTNRVVPDGPDRCRVEFDYYYADAAARALAEGDAAFSARVQEEDRLICEAVQKNLVSGAYVPGRLSPARESALWHFQNLLRADYARAFAS
jgi:choline monooxygenase